MTKTKIKADAQTQAQMLANRVITGPFTIQEIDRMNEAGKVPVDAMFRVTGSTEWVPLRDMPLTTSSAASTGKKP